MTNLESIHGACIKLVLGDLNGSGGVVEELVPNLSAKAGKVVLAPGHRYHVPKRQFIRCVNHHHMVGSTTILGHSYLLLSLTGFQWAYMVFPEKYPKGSMVAKPVG